MVSVNDLLGRARRQPPEDMRLRMIAETSAFLSWALARERNLPVIPLRRVDEGGFRQLAQHGVGRALAAQWWERAVGENWPEHDTITDG